MDAAADGAVQFSYDRRHCLSASHRQAAFVNTSTWEWRGSCEYRPQLACDRLL